MKTRASEAGFTIIELLVTMTIFSIVSVGFYQVLFSATAGVETAQDVVTVSEEARLGFNRMVRDTRQSIGVVSPSATSFTVEIDFSGNGGIEPTPTPGPELGNFERLTYSFTPGPGGNGTISVSGGGLSEVLMRGVDCVRKPDNTCHDVFTFASSRLEWDTAVPDGRTSAAELKVAPGVGNGNGVLDGLELRYVDIVEFSLRVGVGDAQATFYAEAQLRNRR